MQFSISSHIHSIHSATPYSHIIKEHSKLHHICHVKTSYHTIAQNVTHRTSQHTTQHSTSAIKTHHTNSTHHTSFHTTKHNTPYNTTHHSSDSTVHSAHHTTHSHIRPHDHSGGGCFFVLL